MRVGRRGAHGPVRLILGPASRAVLVLALLPPVGSTDALDYAAYGRLTALGINPYVATPIYLRLADPVIGASIPTHWEPPGQPVRPGRDDRAVSRGPARLQLDGPRRSVVKIWNALAGGALVGLAADIKIDYLLLGLGLAWALCRSVPALLAAAAGGLAILAPTYAWLGMPAFRPLVAQRDKTTQDSFCRFVAATGWGRRRGAVCRDDDLAAAPATGGGPWPPGYQAGPCPERGLAVRLAVHTCPGTAP
jgi:hypothetical protein